METIYHGQCEHIFCDDIRSKNCLKRYFEIYDTEKDINYRIAVCNDYFKLKLLENLKDREDWRDKRYFVGEIIKDIISEYSVINHRVRYGDKDLKMIPFSKQIIEMKICEYPELYQRIYLCDAIDLSLKHGFSNLRFRNRRQYGGYIDGCNVIKHHLKQYIRAIDGIKKYKHVYNDLAKDIENLYSYNWNVTELKITELLTKILNYKTK